MPGAQSGDIAGREVVNAPDGRTVIEQDTALLVDVDPALGLRPEGAADDRSSLEGALQGARLVDCAWRMMQSVIGDLL